MFVDSTFVTHADRSHKVVAFPERGAASTMSGTSAVAADDIGKDDENRPNQSNRQGTVLLLCSLVSAALLPDIYVVVAVFVLYVQ